MKTFWSKVPLILTLLLAGLLLCYTVGMTLAPEQTTKAIGYRPYIILTDSMDPVIPPGSLVITKTYQAGQALTPGEIITFRVHVFGEEIFTHYFRGMETLPDGSPWYRTQGAKSEYYDGPEDYDDYPTKEEDILGVCVV
ncbi:MAG: S24/S26 family peptidase, partial [Anaerovoracaceae bacterium]